MELPLATVFSILFAGASIPPETMMHFPPCLISPLFSWFQYIFPPVSRKLFFPPYFYKFPPVLGKFICFLHTLRVFIFPLLSFIHSFIHFEHFYSAPSRRLLRSAPDSSTAKKESF